MAYNNARTVNRRKSSFRFVIFFAFVIPWLLALFARICSENDVYLDRTCRRFFDTFARFLRARAVILSSHATFSHPSDSLSFSLSLALPCYKGHLCKIIITEFSGSILPVAVARARVIRPRENLRHGGCASYLALTRYKPDNRLSENVYFGRRRCSSPGVETFGKSDRLTALGKITDTTVTIINDKIVQRCAGYSLLKTSSLRVEPSRLMGDLMPSISSSSMIGGDVRGP